MKVFSLACTFYQLSMFLAPLKFLNAAWLTWKWNWSEILWLAFDVLYFRLPFQKSNLMFKRLDASTLPEDILSNTQPLPMMAHSAGSALLVCKCVQNCVFAVCASLFVLAQCFSLSWCRTRGGFVALSPISPQELFLQPMSSDTETSQQQNLVRKRANMSIQH